MGVLRVLSEESVDRLHQSVGVGIVDGAGLLDGLTAGHGAAQAVHTDLQEENGGIGSGVQNVADDGLLRNLSHDETSLYIFVFAYHYTMVWRFCQVYNVTYCGKVFTVSVKYFTNHLDKTRRMG